MLEHEVSRHYLTNLALAFDNAKYARELFENDPANAVDWIEIFLQSIRAQFPPVIIDHSIINPDLLGIYHRSEWYGDRQDFNPRHQMICVNGLVCFL
jgi:hypothetical protein